MMVQWWCLSGLRIRYCRCPCHAHRGDYKQDAWALYVCVMTHLQIPLCTIAILYFTATPKRCCHRSRGSAHPLYKHPAPMPHQVCADALCVYYQFSVPSCPSSTRSHDTHVRRIDRLTRGLTHYQQRAAPGLPQQSRPTSDNWLPRVTTLTALVHLLPAPPAPLLHQRQLSPCIRGPSADGTRTTPPCCLPRALSFLTLVVIAHAIAHPAVLYAPNCFMQQVHWSLQEAHSHIRHVLSKVRNAACTHAPGPKQPTLAHGTRTHSLVPARPLRIAHIHTHPTSHFVPPCTLVPLRY